MRCQQAIYDEQNYGCGNEITLEVLICFWPCWSPHVNPRQASVLVRGITGCQIFRFVP
jgi:hypothetical protein